MPPAVDRGAGPAAAQGDEHAHGDGEQQEGDGGGGLGCVLEQQVDLERQGLGGAGQVPREGDRGAELPQGPVAAATAVNDADEVLLLWRHRFITDSWGWELAAGVVEDGEEIQAAAAREMEEETGWRPGPLRPLLTVEPSNGLTDARHHLYWSEEATWTGPPQDAFESSRLEWVPLKLVPDMIARGEVPAANMAAGLLMLHHLRLG